MTQPTRYMALAATLLVALAGCSGDAGTSGPEAIGLTDPSQGLVRGVVTDEELRPLEGAMVQAAGSEQVALTDATGAFELGPLPAADLDLLVSAPGFEPKTVVVRVVAGDFVEVTVALRALPGGAPYVEVFPFSGFEACQWYIPIGLAHCTVGYTILHGTLMEEGVNATQYGLPPDVQDNRDKYNFTVLDPNATIVSELHWKAASSAATWQALVLACAWYDPTVDECVPPGETHTGLRYFGVVGTNPIRVEWKHPTPEHLPWVMSRANVNGNTTDARPAGVALDQRIDMYNSVFYGMPAPEGYWAGPIDS